MEGFTGGQVSLDKEEFTRDREVKVRKGLLEQGWSW